MMNNQNFKSNFLDAAELEAVDYDHVQTLKELKTSLEEVFSEEFGTDAFMMYYLGKIKRPVYNQDDQVVLKENGTPKTKTKDFMSHFAHERFADEFGINFGSLHIQVFKPYFMALAMHEYTQNPDYDSLASDLFEDIVDAANNNLRKDYDKLTEKAKIRIVDSMGYAVSVMIEHKKPNSLTMAELIDPMDQNENPGPK